MESTVSDATDDMKTTPTQFDFEKAQAQAEDYVRESPSKAVGIAVFAGFVLAMLPIGGIIGALIRLLLFLVRPALMILGVVKVCEEIQRASEE
jgi:ElaB/YqjD/DUF883 family membrane-anchored ribosome-binding protein